MTLLQMGDTRFNTVYLTLTSIEAIFQELHKKLEARGEIVHINKSTGQTELFDRLFEAIL